MHMFDNFLNVCILYVCVLRMKVDNITTVAFN